MKWLLFVSNILWCYAQQRPVRPDLNIVRGNPATPDGLRPGARNLPLGLAAFQQFVGQLARLNLYQPEDPFEPVYYVEGLDKVPINWRKRIPILELAPNLYPSDSLAEKLYAANYIDNNVPDVGYPNPYDPRRYDPFGGTRPGFRNVPGFGRSILLKRKKRAAKLLRRMKRQAQPVRDPSEPIDLAKAAAEEGLSSEKFSTEDLARIAQQQERERQRMEEEKRRKKADEERRRIQNYIDSLLTNNPPPVQAGDLQYNRNCLRHFRGPFPHPSYLNGVLVDACNQPIPSEYILGAKPGSKKGRIIRVGDYQERHAGYDFQGYPIPQPDTSDPLFVGCKDEDGKGHGKGGDRNDRTRSGRNRATNRDIFNGRSSSIRREKCKDGPPPLTDPRRDPFLDVPTVRPVNPIDPLTGKFRNPGINAQTYSRLLAGFVPRGQNPIPQLQNIYEMAQGKSFFGNPGK